MNIKVATDNQNNFIQNINTPLQSASNLYLNGNQSNSLNTFYQLEITFNTQATCFFQTLTRFRQKCQEIPLIKIDTVPFLKDKASTILKEMASLETKIHEKDIISNSFMYYKRSD